MTLAILLIGLVVLILCRMPVALAMFLMSAGYLLLDSGGSLRIAVQQTVGGVDSFPLLAVPFFVFIGYLAVGAGISERLFILADALLGRIRAGLGYVNVVTSLLFSTMNGSALADSASLGRALVPDMVKRGYSKEFSVGVTASSSLVGPMLPPSVPAILFAVTANVSIAGLFAAAIVPTLMVTVLMCIGVFIYGMRSKRQGVELKSSVRYPKKQVVSEFLKAIPALLTPVILLGGILGGYFTPTEAACIAVVYLIVLGLVSRRFNLRKLTQLFKEAASTTASIMITIAAASLYGWILTWEGAADVVMTLVAGLGDNAFLFLLIANLIMLIVGMFLDASPAILVLVPVLMPTVMSLDINPLHFGIILVFNLMIGLLTPPVGMILYVLTHVTRYKFSVVLRGTLPFLAILLTGLLILTYVPVISTWLPGVLGH